MKAKSKNDIKKWSEKHTEALLTDIGIKKGQTVLDFGCNEGSYTIPAARIVEEKGKIYALDKEGKSLVKTMKKVKSKGLKNVIGIISSNELQIPLRKNSVDVVLLYDVLHKGFFPKIEDRKKILSSIYKVLRKNGFVSVYLTHLRQFGTTFKKAMEEIENVGFVCCGEYHKKVIHSENLVKGRIFTYRKTKTQE